ncbi:MAG: hypothetical protein ACK5H1_08995 [Tenacibaculum sp.]
MLKPILLPLLIWVCVIISCNKPTVDDFTYFGGKIINPKDSFVVLKNSKGFKDTLYLSKENTFLKKYKKFDKGLYYFKHGNEHQYAYIQSKDSIMLRLNTWDFDESLVFSGENAEINNLLIETFLKHEEEERIIMHQQKTNPYEFVAKMDSLLMSKRKILDKYKQKNTNLPKDFLDIYQIALTYPVYSNLERYIVHNCSKLKSDSVINKFLKHRSQVQLGRDSLMFYGPYYRFMIQKLYSESKLKGLEKKSEDFVIDLLYNIDKELKNEKIKNNILFRVVAYSFIKRVRENENKKVFYNYFKLSTDLNHKKEIQRLINDLNYIENNKKIPNFKVKKTAKNWVNISELIQSKNYTAICLNSSRYFSDKNVSERFNFLLDKYPKVNFIIVEKNQDKNNYLNGIDLKHQYTLAENNKTLNFITSSFPRLIIVNKKGIIQNKYTNLFAFDIEKQIEELQKN